MHRNLATSAASRPSQPSSGLPTSQPAAPSHSHNSPFSHHPASYHSPPLPSDPHPHVYQQHLYHGVAHAQPVGRHNWPSQPHAQYSSSSGTSTSPTAGTSQSSNPIPAGIPLYHQHHVPQQHHHRMPPVDPHLQLRRQSDMYQMIPLPPPSMDFRVHDALSRHAPALASGLIQPIDNPAAHEPMPSHVQEPPLLRKSQSDPHMRPEDARSIRADPDGPPWGVGDIDGARERDAYMSQQQRALLQDRRRKRACDEPHPTSRMVGNAELTLAAPSHTAHHNHAGSRRPEPPPEGPAAVPWRAPGPSEARPAAASLRMSRRQARQQEHMDQQQMQSFRLQRAGLLPGHPHVRHPAPHHVHHPIAPPPPHFSTVSPDAAHFMDALKIHSPSAHAPSTSPTALHHPHTTSATRVAPQSTSPQSALARYEPMDQKRGTSADEPIVCKFPQYLAIQPGGSDRSETRSLPDQHARDKSASLRRSQPEAPLHLVAAGAGQLFAQPPATWSHSSTAHAARGAEFRARDSEPRMKRPRSTPDMSAAGRLGAHLQQHHPPRESAAAGGSRAFRGRAAMSSVSGPLETAVAAATGGSVRLSGPIVSATASDPVAVEGGETFAKQPARKSIRGLITALKTTLDKVKSKDPAFTSPPPMHLSIGQSTSVLPLLSPTLSVPATADAAGDGAAHGNRFQAHSAPEASGRRPVAGHVVQTRAPEGGRPLTSFVFSLPIPAPTPPMRQLEPGMVSLRRPSTDQVERGERERGCEARIADRDQVQRVSHDVHAAAAVLAAEMMARSEPSTSPVTSNPAPVPLVAFTPSSALQQVAAVAHAGDMSLDQHVFGAADQQLQSLGRLQQPLLGPIGQLPLPNPVPNPQHFQQQQAQGPTAMSMAAVNNPLATYGNPSLAPVNMTAEMEALMSDPALLNAFIGASDIGAGLLALGSAGVSPLFLNPSKQSNNSNTDSLPLDRAGASDTVEFGSPGLVDAASNNKAQQQQEPQYPHQQPQLAPYLCFQQQPQQLNVNGPAQLLLHQGLYSPITANPSPSNPSMGHFPPLQMPGVPLQGPGAMNPIALAFPIPPAAGFFSVASPISPISPTWSAFHSQDMPAIEAQQSLFGNLAALPNSHSQANQGHQHPGASGH